MSSRGTICALSTPPGEGALALVRLSGAGAREVLARLCGRAADSFVERRATLVRLEAARGISDEVVATVYLAPRSYTGEDVVELSCHGNPLIAEAIVEAALAAGARAAEPGEFTRRAFVAGRIDLTQAEAVARLIGARSERALQNAQAQLEGALGRRVAALREQALALAADLEACIDFADDIAAPVPRVQLEDQAARLAEALSKLSSSYADGLRLDGVAIALAGEVNAGKSSLFNALLGRERALVSQEAGTTRDYLEAELSWHGVRVTLVDTAGTRPLERMSPLEAAGHRLGAERLGRCDLVVELVDVSTVQPLDAAAADSAATGSSGGAAVLARAGGASDAARLVVAAKSDLVADEAELARRVARLSATSGGAPVVIASARAERGLDDLRASALAAVFDGAPGGAAETVHVTERRQFDALRRAEAALSACGAALAEDVAPELVVEHVREALGALGEITGEQFTEAVLDHVFARFCIGK